MRAIKKFPREARAESDAQDGRRERLFNEKEGRAPLPIRLMTPALIGAGTASHHAPGQWASAAGDDTLLITRRPIARGINYARSPPAYAQTSFPFERQREILLPS